LSIRVSLPWSDEGWFANPAYNLITRGTFGTEVLDPTAGFRTNKLTGIHEHTYWIMPLFPLAQAGWSEVAGFGLKRLRLLSLLWGLAILAAWWRINDDLAGRYAAALALAAMAVDFTITWSSSVARMDAMAAALGGGALALYFMLRHERLGAAVFASQALVAAAGMTHPQAVGYLCGLVFLTPYLDRKRISWRHVAVGVLPYVIGGGLWILYISRDPSAFWAQFGGNAADRGLHLNDPMSIIHYQIVVRYLYDFGMAPDTQGFSHLKIFILMAYFGGLFYAIAQPAIRRAPGPRTLMLLAAAVLVPMMAIDREAQHVYLIHFVVWLISIASMSAVYLWQQAPRARWALAAAAAVVAAVQVGTALSRAAHDPYGKDYLPVAEYLRQHIRQGQLAMGSAEFGYALGFDGVRLTDDQRLGFRSGKRPDFVVLDKNRYQEWIPQFQTTEPDTYQHITTMLARQFHPVMANGAYKLYERNGVE
jgi:4-amino-4-deoxy-L-arabinose transferase-like glycosyltransferase